LELAVHETLSVKAEIETATCWQCV